MRPLIFDYAKKCKEDNAVPVFSYDWDNNLNVIKVNGNLIPFIHASSRFNEGKTKTFAKREGDDSQIALMAEYQETVTRTRVIAERDDAMGVDGFDINTSEKFSMIDYLKFCELVTKTDARRERDDNI